MTLKKEYNLKRAHSLFPFLPQQIVDWLVQSRSCVPVLTECEFTCVRVWGWENSPSVWDEEYGAHLTKSPVGILECSKPASQKACFRADLCQAFSFLLNFRYVIWYSLVCLKPWSASVSRSTECVASVVAAFPSCRWLAHVHLSDGAKDKITSSFSAYACVELLNSRMGSVHFHCWVCFSWSWQEMYLAEEDPHSNCFGMTEQQQSCSSILPYSEQSAKGNRCSQLRFRKKAFGVFGWVGETTEITTLQLLYKCKIVNRAYDLEMCRVWLSDWCRL